VDPCRLSIHANLLSVRGRRDREVRRAERRLVSSSPDLSVSSVQQRRVRSGRL